MSRHNYPGHTPGPWACNRMREQHTGKIVVTAAGLDPIALVHNGNVHAEADARLIAAAPDLLAAIEAIVCTGVGKGDSENMMNARAAYQKAIGTRP